MVDVSGIPNMGFGGGGYFGGSAALGQPAMSAAQINAGIWGNYSPGAAQATQNNIYGAGGFGAQPAYYAGLGAAYGRATGGFGGYGAANADPFTPFQSPEAAASLAAFNYGGYNAPRQYGWMPNEGASYPAAPQPWSMGEFKPQTYGWEHNEGAPVPAQPDFNDLWVGRGAWGLGRDNLFNSYTVAPTPQAPQQSWMQQLYGGMGLPQPWTSPMSPNAGAGWGGFDSGMGIKGPQQQSSLSPEAAASLAAFSYGGGGGAAWATGTPAGTRSAVPNVGSYMPSGQFGGENTGMFGMNIPNFSLGASGLWGGGGDTAALGGYPFGGYVSGGGGNLTAQDRAIPYSGFGFGSGSPYLGGGGFGMPGSLQNGGLYSRGGYPALVGAAQDPYGNPAFSGNANPYATGGGAFGGGAGIGGFNWGSL